MAIGIDRISKRYRLGAKQAEYDTFRDALVSRVRLSTRRARGVGPRSHERIYIWALKDVSFEVKRGDVVGVIGGNGAGKSTLLKILSRITEPTSGQAEIHGRVGSLLEVGAGFHGELTGRENIYLNGAILGMKRGEIRRKFDEIVQFAEVDDFIDTPVKRYSSGMYLRLAFAVAAHMEPEIMLIDEVLAVGDVGFQKKCLGKMHDVSREGRTVLFVSHNLAAVGRLCPTTVWLDHGSVAALGESSRVIHKYLISRGAEISTLEWRQPELAPGDEFVRLASVSLRDSDGAPAEQVYQDRPFVVEIRYRILKRMSNASVGFELRTRDGTSVLTSFDVDNPLWNGAARSPGVFASRCLVPGNLLNEGQYTLTLIAGIPFVRRSIHVEEVLSFRVEPSLIGEGPPGRLGAPRLGIIAPEFAWEVEREVSATS